MEEIIMLLSFVELEFDKYVVWRRFWMNYFLFKESSDNLKLFFLI